MTADRLHARSAQKRNTRCNRCDGNRVGCDRASVCPHGTLLLIFSKRELVLWHLRQSGGNVSSMANVASRQIMRTTVKQIRGIVLMAAVLAAGSKFILAPLVQAGTVASTQAQMAER